MLGPAQHLMAASLNDVYSKSIAAKIENMCEKSGVAIFLYGTAYAKNKAN